MLLVFLRHAKAEPGADDASRHLAKPGRRQARAIGRFLRKAGLRCDLAFTSPLARAVETARLTLKENPLRGRARLTITRSLLNGATAAEFSRLLQRLPSSATVLLVGHAPSLAERIAKLLGVAVTDTVHLSTSNVAVIEITESGAASLKLFVKPEHLG